MASSSLDIVIAAAYLVAAVLFIFGLKLLGSPATARSGNRLAALGMLIAIVATLVNREIVDFRMILVGLAIGSVAGVTLARTIKMTAMPQLVAIFNGLGGGASALVAASEFLRLLDGAEEMPLDVSVTIMLGTLIGLVTFSGSIVAFGKLQELMTTRPVTFPLQKSLSLVLFVAILGLGAYLVVAPGLPGYVVLAAACLMLGVLVVVRIGGADMPVVVSLLNSYSGLAVASAGFVLGNVMLIIAGALVGAAGLILTQIMTRAMNRSLANVIFGAFGATVEEVGARQTGDRAVRESTPEDAAIMLAYTNSAIFVPGYGLAVAQAQHQLRELANVIEKRGVTVRYAIHPVAGRMPGHMNVLLAEADVPYDKLFDLDQINDDFPTTELVLVIGANDVVNPAAREEPGSPLYGMPILNADQARHVLVLKRSLNPGFAGIDNALFYKENTSMLFGDARDSLTRLISEIEGL